MTRSGTAPNGVHSKHFFRYFKEFPLESSKETSNSLNFKEMHATEPIDEQRSEMWFVFNPLTSGCFLSIKTKELCQTIAAGPNYTFNEGDCSIFLYFVSI